MNAAEARVAAEDGLRRRLAGEHRIALELLRKRPDIIRSIRGQIANAVQKGEGSTNTITYKMLFTRTEHLVFALDEVARRLEIEDSFVSYYKGPGIPLSCHYLHVNWSCLDLSGGMKYFHEECQLRARDRAGAYLLATRGSW